MKIQNNDAKTGPNDAIDAAKLSVINVINIMAYDITNAE
jgi:hypothetical protein